MKQPNGVFDIYGRYYDLFYRDKDYRAEVAYVDGLLKRVGVAGRDVLEFGSGTGGHGRLLAGRGYRILGIEQSAEMVAQACETDHFKSQQGDIRTVRLNKSFDAVLALFHVISYQTGNADVTAVFASAALHLRKGGVFLFDFWYSPAVQHQRAEVRIKRLESDGLQFIRLAEPVERTEDNCIDVNYTVLARNLGAGTCEVFSEVHPMRHFSLPELDLFAERSGFERVVAEAFQTGGVPGKDSWGVCAVFRKVV